MLRFQRKFAIISLVQAATVLFSAALTNQPRFQQWAIPDRPAFVHDPAFAPGGMVWYTAMKANAVGRFDPQTEKFKTYPLPTPNSGPHGITIGPDGNVWYTGNSAALIGKIDVRAGKVIEYWMPDPNARGPHTPVFDARGILWFTVEQGSFVGTLDPKSGKITLVQPATPDARPYGIQINSQGVPLFDEFGTNQIGSVDPRTMKITDHP